MLVIALTRKMRYNDTVAVMTSPTLAVDMPIRKGRG